MGEARDPVAGMVAVIVGVIVGLTFLFGFGNVFGLAVHLGVPVWLAPLVASAVDLSVVALLVAIRHLATHGASSEVIRPARRLLIFVSVVTLTLNVAEPLVAGQYGKAAFDSVGPLLLIGWSEVGPDLLQAVGTTRLASVASSAEAREVPGRAAGTAEAESQIEQEWFAVRPMGQEPARECTMDALLAHARREDAAHRVAHQRPISAETLRVRIGVGATRARRLVKVVRAEFEQLNARKLGGRRRAGEAGCGDRSSVNGLLPRLDEPSLRERSICRVCHTECREGWGLQGGRTEIVEAKAQQGLVSVPGG